MNTTDKKAVLAAVTGNALWGFSFLLIRLGQRYASTEILLSVRFLFALILLNLWLLFSGRRVTFKGKRLTPLLLLAVTEPTYFFFESYGVQHTNSTIAGVVLAVVPVAAILFGIIFLKEYPAPRQALFCLLPIAGVILISVSGQSLGVVKPLGLLLLLCACFTSAAYKTANRKSSQEFSAFERTYVVLSACAVVFTVVALFRVGGDLGAFLTPLKQPGFVLPVLGLSVFCSVAANFLVNYAAARMPLMQISSIGSVSTLCSMFAGYLFLDEPLTALMLLGCLLILVGVHQVTKE